MALEGEFPASSQGPVEVSATHTPGADNDYEYEFPPKDYPYVGSVVPPPPPESNGPIFPPSYTSWDQLVLSTPSASSLYHRSVCFKRGLPQSCTNCSFVSSYTNNSHDWGNQCPKCSQDPPLSGKYMPPPIPLSGRQHPPLPYVPPVSSGPYVSAPQNHATEVSQNVGSVPYPSGSSIPFGLGQIPYQQPFSAQIPYQKSYLPYGAQQPHNPPFTQQERPLMQPGSNPSFREASQARTYQYQPRTQHIPQGTYQQQTYVQQQPFIQQGNYV